MVYADIDVDTDIWFDDGAPLWTPADLGAAIKSWWNADDHGTANMTDDGAGLVSSWKARVSALNPTATTTARPTWGATAFNGIKAGVTGDGVANILKTTSFNTGVPTGTTPSETWVLMHNPVGGADGVFFHYGAVAGTCRIISRDTANRFKVGDASASQLIPSLPIITGNPCVAAGIWNATNNMGRINGTIPSSVASAASTLGTPTTGALSIFAYNSGALFNAGTIRHIIVTTILTLGQRVRLEGWLAWDGGIQANLVAGHPFRNAPPTTAWIPQDLDTALSTWWNADDHGSINMTDDGAGLISLWRDRVAGVSPAGTTTARPTWAANSFNSSYNGVVGSGVNVLSIPSTSVVPASLTVIPVGATAGELWLVLNSTSVIDACYMFGYGSAGGAGRFLLHDSAPRLRVYDGSAAFTPGAPTPLFTGNMICMGYWSGTTEGGRINGADTTPASGAISSLSTPGGGPLAIFARNTLAQFAACTIRHAFITTLNSQATREKIEGWCAWDSGITSVLPAGHPYKSVRP